MSGAEVLHLRGPLLLGPDEECREAWVVGGRLTFTRPVGQYEVRVVAGWALPGMVDAHCHVGLGSEGEVGRDEAERQALADRDAGALLLRDAGSPADTRWVAEREDLPVLERAGRHIARTRRYLRGFAEEVEPEGLAAEVERQAARGDGWVKIVGDWIDRDTGDLGPCWPLPALTAAIDAAHRAGARVTAHCFGAASLPDLVRAGIDCIEHATGLDGPAAATLAAADVAVVPTLINIETFPGIAAAADGKFPTYAAHMRALHARRYDSVRAAHEAGLRIFAGTDAGGSLAHGRISEEVRELACAGLSSREALTAATWGAREWLGRPGLVEGAPADVIVFRTDPRADLAVLASPTHVVLRGVVVAGSSTG